MRDHVRHLHELEVGARFDHEDDARAGAQVLVEKRESGACAVAAHQLVLEPQAVAFERFRRGKTERVSFTARALAAARPCAGGAQVIPYDHHTTT